jgi:uncharacterized protein (TIGR00730 family)
MKPTITIFCGSKLSINEGLKRGVKDLVEQLGDDFKYAYGGGETGIMGQLNKTCINKGYYTIGINCHRWKDEGDDKLSEVHYFDSIIDRQNALISIGDAYIVLPGGVGTIYEALQCITLNDVKEASKPVFFLNTDNYFNSLFDMLNHGRKMGTISKSNEELKIVVKDNPEELAKEIKKYFSQCIE